MKEKSASGPSKFDEKTLKGAEFCLSKCPPCKTARRKGRGFFYWFVKKEARLYPKCKAYEKVYGVPAYENQPES